MRKRWGEGAPSPLTRALRRKSNRTAIARSRPKRKRRAAGASCGGLRRQTARDPGIRRGCGVGGWRSCSPPASPPTAPAVWGPISEKCGKCVMRGLRDESATIPLPPTAPTRDGPPDGLWPSGVTTFWEERSTFPNPTHSPSCDDGDLPFREPDQVPFWSGGQGQDGPCGRQTVPPGPRQVRPG